jgi:hypothetical protein
LTELEVLQQILETLERIEIALEERQNKTQDAKDCRQLMQNICRHYKETNPPYDIQVGSSLTVQRFRDAIAKIKNIQNTKRETKRLYGYIRKLEEREFIARTSDMTFQVLDTGKDWGEL